MKPEERIEQTNDQVEQPAEYEAPKIESTMTPEDLAREVAYAGVTDFTQPTG